ncbi:MAG: hypothetical protein MUF51_03300 [Vicinamibacteria bacterium]|jgi:uncharacterized protein (TIGR00661 family)|nr:hypothetical protein [Vicinamibacteria bacterium]
MRILYGVMGDARGHVTRARAVAEALPRAEIVFVGGGHARDLAGLGRRVEPVPMPATRYRGARVSVSATLWGALRVFVQAPATLRRLAGLIRAFDPDLIVSDYEFFVPRAARRLARVAVSLDNQHVLTHCRVDPPLSAHRSSVATCLAVRYLYSACHRFLVTSFFPAAPLDPRTTEVFGPLIRAAVRAAAPRDGDHVVVYQTTPCLAPVLPALARYGRPVRSYGLPPRSDTPALDFRPTADKGFIDDLASCAYVICNGSHGLLSEALHLGKPVLALPIGLALEQRVNSEQLARRGWGETCELAQVTPARLAAFESRLDLYRERIPAQRLDDHDAVIGRIEALAQQRVSG